MEKSIFECEDEKKKHCEGEGGSGSCSCHEHENEEINIKQMLCKVLIAVLFAAAAEFLHFQEAYSFILYLVAYLIVGGEVVLTAIKHLLRGKVFDEAFLMSIATVGAFAIGSYPEAVAVMVFYEVGELLQALAVQRSKSNISKLMDIRPDYANLVYDGGERTVDPREVHVGDFIRVKPGERVALDGIVTEGNSFADVSALTGEPVPQELTKGSALLSGSVNLSGTLLVQVSNEFEQSTLQRILQMVSEASEKKAKAEKFITKFAKIYTPVVMGIAATIAFLPALLLGNGFASEWFYRGLVFLVVSCPCALVISIPVSFLGGIGGAARQGILVKGGNLIDTLRAPETIVLDKTGTLTRGSFEITEIAPCKGTDRDELLVAAAAVERESAHPIAKSVRNYCKQIADALNVSEYEEQAGYGVQALVQGERVLAGNLKWMEKNKIILEEALYEGMGTALYVAKNDRYLGYLAASDEIKPNAKQAIADLRALGVKKIVMLTGDREDAARKVAGELGIFDYRAELLPHEKVLAFDELTKGSTGVSVFVGDGMNDAPLLAKADVGIAMGASGVDAAIEAADVVLMTDEVGKIATAIKVARRTHTIVLQNIVFALAVKVGVMAFALFGYTPMWLAIFADVGVALIAVANAARTIGFKER